jgi:hypothetical protein
MTSRIQEFIAWFMIRSMPPHTTLLAFTERHFHPVVVAGTLDLNCELRQSISALTSISNKTTVALYRFTRGRDEEQR